VKAILSKNLVKKSIRFDSFLDVQMTDEEADKGLQESMKLAKELQDEDDKLQAEIDQINSESQQPEGESISKFVNQENSLLI
jgi:hypothetical protein